MYTNKPYKRALWILLTGVGAIIMVGVYLTLTDQASGGLSRRNTEMNMSGPSTIGIGVFAFLIGLYSLKDLKKK